IVLAAPALGADEPKVGERVERRGDEIVACGQLYHTTAPVVLWMDPGGYDAYRLERRFTPVDEAFREVEKEDPGRDRPRPRFALRKKDLTPEQVERVRGGGWDLP